tara:strand:+ start:350 stop:727 length:378 start_codon:yes stop_codon:yes gene_type:complete
MPRKGKGQQANKTVTGQQYGQSLEQEQAQDVIPLPKIEEPPISTMRPGDMQLTGPTSRPSESIITPAGGRPQSKPLSSERKAQILAVLPALELRASHRDSSFQLRKLVREMKATVRVNQNNEIGS